jgi:chromatin segregation and condensation protein Rec8/ScpA/Scc1 (kleisin family)
MMAAGEGDDEVRERAMMNLLAGLPEHERERTLARMLDEMERLHRESGAAVPGWIGRLRERHGLG